MKRLPILQFTLALTVATLFAACPAGAQIPYAPQLAPHPRNLILNGDFSGGNIAFGSDYACNNNSTNVITGAGTYGVIRNPAVDYIANGNYANFTDHTNGRGQMLFADGSSQGADAAVWMQTVNVAPNTAYTFSFWATEAYPQNGPTLRVTADDTQVGTDTYVPPPAGKWMKLTCTVKSGSRLNMTLKIADLATDYGGNDFCIDDISLVGKAPGLEIASVAPNSLILGAQTVHIALAGTHFAPDDIVMLDGARLATSYVSATQLTATVTPDLLQTARQARLQVMSPSTGKTSNALPLPISPPAQ